MRRTICALFSNVLILALVAACGGPSTGVRSAGGGDADVAARFPVLRFAPERPTYALASARTSDLISAFREFVAAVGLLADGDLAQIDRETLREFGFNPFSLKTLTQAGVDASGGALLFSNGFLPTLVLPIADAKKFDGFLDRRRPKRGLQVRQYQGRDWFSYTVDKPLSIQWIRWDGYLAIRLSMDKEVKSVAWLDDMFDESSSLARARSMKRALGAIDARVSDAKVAGLLDPVGILDSIVEHLPDDKAKKLSACTDLFAPLDGAIAIGAHLDWGSASGALKIGLTRRAASALRKHVATPPPGYRNIREQAGVYASLGLDPQWLEKQRAGVECPLWEEPLVGKKGTFKYLPSSLSAAFAAVLELRPKSGDMRAAGYLGFHDKALPEAILGLIPQRRFLERKSTIAEQPVRVIALPIAPKVIYQLGEKSLLMTIGDNVMTDVLSPPKDTPESEPGLDIMSLGIYPSRLPELQDILIYVARYMQISEHFARNSYRRLQRYDHGRVDVTLEGNDLVIRLGMRLARL